jgi:hypothetical protein
MPQLVDIPNVGQVEFPDSMSHEQIVGAIQNNILKSNPTPRKGIDTSILENPIFKNMPIATAAALGIKEGVTDAGRGLKQLALTGAEKIGIQPEGTAANYTKETDQARKEFDNSLTSQLFPTATGWGEMTGNAAPFIAGSAALTPAKAGLGLLSRLGATGAEGATAGFTQYVPEGGSRAFNTITGGLLALGGQAAGEGIGAAYGWGKNKLAQNMLAGVDEKAALEGKAAADRLGLSYISPAEAGGSPLAAGAQGRLGTSSKGALNLQQRGMVRLDSEKAAINSFLSDIAPNNASAAQDLRGVARKVISKEEKALSNAARPFYNEAYKVEVPQDTYKTLREDGIISRSIDRVMKEPIYSNELKGVSPTSLKVLDLAKKDMDDLISTAQRSGEKNATRLITQSKSNLLDVMDNLSPDYKAGRNLYSEGAKPLEALKNSNLGKIADLSDTQLKTVSKTIFDPSQTDPKVLADLQKRITSANPDVWNRIVRNEMERKLGMVKGDLNGSKFYNQILAKDRDFNQIISATKNIPGATQKLNDMRKSFKNLINPLTAKGAAGQTRNNLNQPRNFLDAAKNQVSNFLGGKYDEAAVDFVTSNKWDKEFKAIQNIKDNQERIARLGELLGKIGGVAAVRNNNDIFAEDK